MKTRPFVLRKPIGTTIGMWGLLGKGGCITGMLYRCVELHKASSIHRLETVGWGGTAACLHQLNCDGKHNIM